VYAYITHLLRWLKISFAKREGALLALGLFAFGVGVRLLLISQTWPHANFDEGTIGEMALNIAYHGEYPTYFYGQDYMGALQAYVAAVFFYLFGVSLFSLRLGLVLFITVFLMCMYMLTSMIYTRKLALLTLFLLGLGANLVLYRELQAIGGYPDTLMFGSLALLFATWLARTSHRERHRTLRFLVYGGYGLVVGLGLWTDLLILPCVVFSGLLLLLFCRRDVCSFVPLLLLFFLLLGISPTIWHGLHAAPGQSTISAVVAVFHGRHTSILHTLPGSALSATLIGLPTFTNYNPVCPVSDTLFFGGSGPGALACAVVQGSWGLGAIVLWFCSLLLSVKALYTTWKQTNRGAEEKRQDIIRICARLTVLGIAASSFVAFAISPTAIFSPYLSSRYLICILIGTPTLMYPLWSATGAIKIWKGWRKSVSVVSGIALISIVFMFLLGTLRVLQDMPDASFTNNQQYGLIHKLIHIGATHIYSDFVDCDRIIFLSLEKVACNTMDDQMYPTGSRYPVFGQIVTHDPLASYVFPLNSPQAAMCEQRFGHNRLYRHFTFDGYAVYQPSFRTT
jgi:4-amino-4-deoxy-L-arabinose transferase-like glycosyltransferase